MNRLEIKIGNNIYTDKISGISIGYEQNILDATVFVDGSENLNQFNVTNDSDWIDIRRIRNQVTIIVSKNNTLDKRSGVIEFTHNLDSDVFIRLNICQDSCNYDIWVDQDYLLFDTLLDKDDPEKTEVTINVTTLNGMCDFGIGPVAEYARNFEFVQYEIGETIFEGDTYYVKTGNKYNKDESLVVFPYVIQSGDEYYHYELNDVYREGEIIYAGQKYWHKNNKKYQISTAAENIVIPNNNNEYYRILNDHNITYDHGLKLTKLNNKKLKITNYGKVCLYDDFYYILTLYHINNPKCVAQIRVDYVDSFANNETGLDFEDEEQDN